MRPLRNQAYVHLILILGVSLSLISCWNSKPPGNNSSTPVAGNCTSGAPGTPVIQTSAVASGLFHTIALDGDGAVWTWGQNSQGQLGNGTITECHTPTRVGGLTGTKIAGGYNHTLALKPDGSLWAWGLNSDGQLGNNSLTNNTTPVQVSVLSSVQAIAGGGAHSLAIESDGTVWAWGDNSYGQLGNGSIIGSNIPVQVLGLTGVIIPIAGGGSHSIAQKSDGTLWAWGLNGAGQLGNGSNNNSSIPVQVSGVLGLTGVSAVSAGENHTVAYDGTGAVWTWGSNAKGQLGNGSGLDSNIPVKVTVLSSVIAIASGYNYTIALKGDGTVWAWGDNLFGQLGLGTADSNPHSVPAQVTDPNDSSGFLTGVITIAGGGNHSIAVKDNGTVWAWGENQNGQLGDGTIVSRSTPVQVSGLLLF
jgi:alpha-tubulin suppressor-like RCC1 family protein